MTIRSAGSLWSRLLAVATGGSAIGLLAAGALGVAVHHPKGTGSVSIAGAPLTAPSLPHSLPTVPTTPAEHTTLTTPTSTAALLPTPSATQESLSAAPDCAALSPAPAANLVDSSSYVIDAADPWRDRLPTDFVAGRLWVADGPTALDYDELLGIGSGAKEKVSIPDSMDVFAVGSSTAWTQTDTGVEVVSLASDSVTRSWTQQQLRLGSGGYISVIWLVGSDSEAWAVGYYYPSSQSASGGRFAVAALTPSSEAPVWTDVLPYAARDASGGDLALGPDGLYVVLQEVPSAGMVTVLRVSPTSGAVIDRSSFPISYDHPQASLTYTGGNLYLDVSRLDNNTDPPTALPNQLFRLDPLTGSPLASIYVWNPQGTDATDGRLDLYASECAGATWLWQLQPDALTLDNGPRSLPGDTLFLRDNNGTPVFIEDPDTTSMGLYQVSGP